MPFPPGSINPHPFGDTVVPRLLVGRLSSVRVRIEEVEDRVVAFDFRPLERMLKIPVTGLLTLVKGGVGGGLGICKDGNRAVSFGVFTAAGTRSADAAIRAAPSAHLALSSSSVQNLLGFSPDESFSDKHSGLWTGRIVDDWGVVSGVIGCWL